MYMRSVVFAIGLLLLATAAGCLSQPDPASQPPAIEPIAFFSEPGPQPTACGSCAFVGSKHSNVYHAPHCSYAYRILPENCVCFQSRDEALATGYRGARDADLIVYPICNWIFGWNATSDWILSFDSPLYSPAKRYLMSSSTPTRLV